MAKNGKGPTAALPTAARNPTTRAVRAPACLDICVACCGDPIAADLG